MISNNALMAASVAGWILSLLGAIGVKTLREFSRHDLDLHCKRRGAKGLFKEVIARHDEVALGAEFVQIAGLVLAVGAGAPLMAGPAPWSTLRLAAAMGGLLLLLLLCLSWIPWGLARVVSGRLLYHTWPLWKALYVVAAPVRLGATFFSSLVARLADRPDPSDEDEEQVFEEEMRAIVSQGYGEGVLEDGTRDMLEGVMELDEQDVGDVMTPRSVVDAIEVGMPWGEMVAFVAETRRTRLPVYEKELDNVLGVLYVKDLLAEMAKSNPTERRPLRKLLRTPRKVIKSAKLDEMLHHFLQDRIHLAIVVGEFDGVEGVVTIEDVLEEIVGEIDDEKDLGEPEIHRASESVTIAVGRAHVSELNESLGLSLPEDEDYDTIAGYVVRHFGRLPSVGESWEVDGARITVVEANEKAVQKVRLELRQPSDT